MTKTANDVVVRTLRRINAIAANETPQADMYQEALGEYKAFHEWMLKEFGNARWTYNAVPEQYWTYVSGWLAGDLCDVIATSENNRIRAKQGAAMAETRLREMLARKKLKYTEAVYF